MGTTAAPRRGLVSGGSREPLFGALFLLVSIPVFLVWTLLAKTEKGYVPGGDGKTGPQWRTITGMVHGEVPAPFVWRRLLPDAAEILSESVPPAFWRGLSRQIEGASRWQGVLRRVIRERLGWMPEHYPLLFSAHFLIWLSILGFIYGCRSFAAAHYRATPWAGFWTASLLGIGLLGGSGAWNHYPYDLPQACVFLFALNGMVARRWWLWPAFAAAAYSKETSVLLILAYSLLYRRHGRSFGYWLTLGALSCMFAAIQLWIRQRHPAAPPMDFWFPGRNAAFLVKEFFQNFWFVAVFGVVLVSITRSWRRIPSGLRWLLPLVPVMVGLAFFKGWVNERRGYLEIYPILGLVLIQWASVELGFERSFTPRSGAGDYPADPPPDSYNRT